MQKPSEREQWFIGRIGKIVYVNMTSCPCAACNYSCNNWLLIESNAHAIYLYDREHMHNVEGHNLKYFDTREEVLSFEKMNDNK